MAAQPGHPLRINQVLIGYTAITTTSASTSGPTNQATARTPATVITTAAAPNMMISARGIAVRGSRTPLVVLGRMSTASWSSSLMASILGSVCAERHRGTSRRRTYVPDRSHDPGPQAGDARHSPGWWRTS
jgi:hypothetical protein